MDIVKSGTLGQERVYLGQSVKLSQVPVPLLLLRHSFPRMVPNLLGTLPWYLWVSSVEVAIISTAF